MTKLISRVSRELGPEAPDEEVSGKVLDAVEALSESDRAQVLEQLVKAVSSGQLRHLDKELDAVRREGGGQSMPDTESAP